jgi:hypothetical protein
MRAVGAAKRKVGRPPTVNTLVPRQPDSWESAAIAAQLQEILDALEVPPIDSETRGIFQRILYRQKYFGGDARGQVVITLRCIMESSGNESALIGPTVRAVSHCMTPELINRGLQLIEAFDRIPLVSVLETMRAASMSSARTRWATTFRSLFGTSFPRSLSQPAAARHRNRCVSGASRNRRA